MATTTKSKAVAKTKVSKPSTIELSEAGVKAVKAFIKAKNAEAKAKALKAEAEALLRAELGAVAGTTATIQGVPVASIVGGKNTHFDRDLMKTAYTEAYEACLQATEYTDIQTNK